jgi:hypothetical protein
LEAERLFRSSYDDLSIVGTQHLEEAGTNIATALLLQRRWDEARNQLAKVLAFAEMDFPRMIAESNMAMIEASSGNLSQARERILRLLLVVDAVGIDDSSWRVRLTAALIDALTVGPSASTQTYLEEAISFGASPDQVDKIKRAMMSSTFTAESALSMYPYEYLQYWSQNPLKVLPAEALTPQTVLDNVA